MARNIWINWSRGYDYVGGFRDAMATSSAPTNLYKAVQDLRMSYGIYMMLERPGFEPRRDAAISQWRGDMGLNASTRAGNLIYVGIVKSAKRDFVMRMHEHEKKWLWQYRHKGNLLLKFGRVEYRVADTELPQLIEDAESVIVFEMQPYENTTKIASYSIADTIVVHNSGSHGPLPKVMRSSKHLI